MYQYTQIIYYCDLLEIILKLLIKITLLLGFQPTVYCNSFMIMLKMDIDFYTQKKNLRKKVQTAKWEQQCSADTFFDGNGMWQAAL